MSVTMFVVVQSPLPKTHIIYTDFDHFLEDLEKLQKSGNFNGLEKSGNIQKTLANFLQWPNLFLIKPSKIHSYVSSA